MSNYETDDEQDSYQNWATAAQTLTQTTTTINTYNKNNNTTTIDSAITIACDDSDSDGTEDYVPSDEETFTDLRITSNIGQPITDEQQNMQIEEKTDCRVTKSPTITTHSATTTRRTILNPFATSSITPLIPIIKPSSTSTPFPITEAFAKPLPLSVNTVSLSSSTPSILSSPLVSTSPVTTPATPSTTTSSRRRIPKKAPEVIEVQRTSSDSAAEETKEAATPVNNNKQYPVQPWTDDVPSTVSNNPSRIVSSPLSNIQSIVSPSTISVSTLSMTRSISSPVDNNSTVISDSTSNYQIGSIDYTQHAQKSNKHYEQASISIKNGKQVSSISDFDNPIKNQIQQFDKAQQHTVVDKQPTQPTAVTNVTMEVINFRL